MRILLISALAAVLITAFALTAAAETKVDVGGQIRVRTEFDDRALPDLGYEMEVFTLMRTRLGVGATVDGNARVFVQFQDSRMFGDEDQSGTLVNGKNVDVHQAYLEIGKLWVDGLGLKLGRFEVNLGNQRVFGAVGWSNVGRSWEGVVLRYKAEQVKLKGLALKAREFDDPRVGPYGVFGSVSNRDFDIFGIVANIVDPDLELFCTYEYDADTLFAGRDGNDLDRITLGGYFQNEVDDLDYEFNAAYQMGRLHDDLDISAFMLAVEVGYSFPEHKNARIAGGFDYTSGEEDLTDDDWNAYDNLYYTGHKFRGYMDYFTESNVDGLIDIMGRGRIEFARNWWLMGDFHWFRKAKEFAPPFESVSDVGSELDLTVTTKSIQAVDLTGGASFFFPADESVSVIDPYGSVRDPNTGVWLYYMFTVSFD